MAKWKYIDPPPPDQHGDVNWDCPIEYIVTDEWILENYFPVWSEELCKQGKDNLINSQNCIDDFVVVNWCEKME